MTGPVVQEHLFLEFLSQRSLDWDGNLGVLGNSGDGFELVTHLVNLLAGIASLKDIAFPAKHCKLFTGRNEDHKSSLCKALNLPFLSSGNKKACNIESELKPKNLTWDQIEVLTHVSVIDNYTVIQVHPSTALH